MQLLHKPKMSKSKDRQKALSEKLKLARENAGMTQAEAARLLKKPQWFVSRCENGQRKIDVTELMAFAEIYHIDLSRFLGELR